MAFSDHLQPLLRPGFTILLGLWACQPGEFDALVGGPRPAGAGAGSAGTVPTMQRADAGPSKPSTGAGDVADAGDADARVEDAGSRQPVPACPTAADPSRIVLSSSELGTLPNSPVVNGRVGAASTRVGDQILWLFHAPMDGMAVWTEPDGLLENPPRLREPPEFVPLLPRAALPNGTGQTGGAMAWNDHEAMFFFGAFDVWTPLGVGLARIQLGASQAEALRPAGTLFAAPSDVEPMAYRPFFFVGAFLDERTALVYVYACNANPAAPDEQAGGAHDQPCRIARVPSSSIEDGASYLYWNGSQWVAEVAGAAVVLDHVQGGTLSVSYNRYLDRYLAVHSGAASAVVLRWAEHPQGPFVTLGQFQTAPAMGGFGFTHAALEHTSLREPCHDVTYVTYARPIEVPGDGGTQASYETRLVRIELSERR